MRAAFWNVAVREKKLSIGICTYGAVNVWLDDSEVCGGTESLSGELYFTMSDPDHFDSLENHTLNDRG